MSAESNGRPSLLANLILMLIIGGVLVGFIVMIRKWNKEKETPGQVTNGANPTKKLSPEEEAKRVEEANKTRALKLQAVPQDPKEAEETRKALAESMARKPFTRQPVMPESDEAPTPPPAREEVREVASSSPEGAALLKDAIARIDEAPSDLYSDKAKAKVREGLSKARRIFKIHTIFFEKGGAVPNPEDSALLNSALAEGALQEAMEDPRSIFFILGFADKTGDPATNQKLSQARADTAIAMLKSNGVINLTYPVAVGGTELIAPENQNKNRATEVWLVVP